MLRLFRMSIQIIDYCLQITLSCKVHRNEKIHESRTTHPTNFFPLLSQPSAKFRHKLIHRTDEISIR